MSQVQLIALISWVFSLFVSGHIQVLRTAKGDGDDTLIERGQRAAYFSCINILCIFLFKPKVLSIVPYWPSESELLVKGLKDNIKRGEKKLKRGLQIQ